jgi:hypothetical protein
MIYRAFIALTLVASGPGAGQVADPLAMTTDAGDRAVMVEAASAAASRTPDIARLNAVLAKLPRPTPLRGMVQTVRAGVLANAKDAGPAVAAVEDALRLLPDDPRPKLMAAGIFTFSGSPQRAADLWMEASRLSPDFARTTDRYLVTALIGRLTDIGDRARADRINARLSEIGFSTGLAPERSSASLAKVRQAVSNQQQTDAQLAVTMIGDPEDLLTLYIDKRYTALWPRIAEWAGPDLAGQSRRYLEELRADWQAADDFETAAPYARRLAKLQAYTVINTLFLPMFDRLRPGVDAPGAETLAPVVSRSLMLQGRATEARAVLAKVAAAMPADDQGNTLNIDAAYVTLATMQADWRDVVTRADTFLARARSLGTNVNQSAVIQVQAWRACALSRLNSTAEAEKAAAVVALSEALQPSAAMNLYICRGDSARARALVISRLADELTRGWALHFVQPVRPDAVVTPLDDIMIIVQATVRSAPDVVAAANRVGRILPQPANAVLPSGFEPFRARPAEEPLGSGAV